MAGSSYWIPLCLSNHFGHVYLLIAITTLISQSCWPSLNPVYHCLTHHLHLALRSLTPCPSPLSVTYQFEKLPSVPFISYSASYLCLHSHCYLLLIFFSMSNFHFALTQSLPPVLQCTCFSCGLARQICLLSPPPCPCVKVFHLPLILCDFSAFNSPALLSSSLSRSSQLPKTAAGSAWCWLDISSRMCEHQSWLGRAQTPGSPRRSIVPAGRQRGAVPLNCSQWTTSTGCVT